jgi:hypothetical protein
MMDAQEAERIGRTESLFREVNERIAETTNSADESFVCECPDPACTHRVPVPLGDYERVRADPTQFVHAPGHGDDRVEQVVERRSRFNVVKKVEARVAATVKRLDPRAA